MLKYVTTGMTFALLAAAAHAASDPRLDGLKRVERSRCERAGNTGPGAPKNLKLVPKYCECVANNYYDNLPKEEVDQLLSAGQSESIDERREVRLAQARTACKVQP
ncbi:hypothetical protein GCM10027277_31930 [Pseudoduganella ginsengisoli]|uniref:Uncharacterized protein n=1 Tax=Pseudoduganella ginsengisoli TaxID=1462440 RepID=A0A6L6PZL5_9BURK|nr:hypothetical protein [Pseudoduganella ginsengisoli]MTW02604.1 hypothetical protein [Pseudoduganella ginsengisoli]